MPKLLTEARRFRIVRRRPLALPRPRVFAGGVSRAARGAAARSRAHFLELLERAVYARPSSPYRALLVHVGAEHGDVAALVRDLGIEDALGRLHEQGVYLTLEEFTGHRRDRPAGRARAADATTRTSTTPCSAGGYSGASGGSRRRAAPHDGRLRPSRAPDRVRSVSYLEAFGLEGRPAVLWRPAPPAKSGFNNALRTLRIGCFGRVVRAEPPRLPRRRAAGLDRASHGARRDAPSRPAMPKPRHVPLDRAEVVARRLAELVAAGTPAIFAGSGGSGVRVALAAAAAGLDLSGTVFRLGGEPLTRGEAGGRRASRCVGHCNYSMSELGRVGLAVRARRPTRDRRRARADGQGRDVPASDGRRGRRRACARDHVARPDDAEADAERRERRHRRARRARLRLRGRRRRATGSTCTRSAATTS